MKGELYGVSLGPGDANLITVKGLHILEKVDKIYYPGSVFKGGRKSSYSLSILEQYNLASEKLEGFYLKMDIERAQAKVIYETTFQKILVDYNNGLSIAIVSEGDISTFSSFSYLLEKIEAQHLAIELIPGISSYLHLASESKTPLCLQNEKVAIIPRVQSKEELNEALLSFDTVVLMKIMTVLDTINAVIDEEKHQLTYAERLGTNKQFITTKWQLAKQRTIPYFSLVIIKKLSK
jgi:precorrin-2/cobalt-factor-2 C20-methyltransferase